MNRISHRLETHQHSAWISIISLFILGQVIVSLIVDLPLAPKIAPDSLRYLNGGEHFPHLDSSQFGYVGYCFVMWIDRLLGAKNWFAVAVQVSATLVAARALWALTKQYGGTLAALISAALFLLNPLIATWTRYVLTESLFYSSTVFLLVGLERAFAHRRGCWPVLGLGLLGTLTIRPNGSILIPGMLAYLVLKGFHSYRFKMGLAASIFLLSLAAIVSMPSLQSGGGGRENSFVQRTAAGEVFWGEDQWSIDMPDADPSQSSNLDFITYVIRHPLSVARLGVTRLAWELIQVRSSRGVFFNVITGLTMTAFFVSFAGGARRLRHSPLVRSVAFISIPYMILIMATWAISEGRFGWWFMTTWIPICAVGISTCIRPGVDAARDEKSDGAKSDQPSRASDHFLHA